MSTLETLLGLSTKMVEEKQKVIGVLNADIAAFQSRIDSLNSAMLSETDGAAKISDAGYFIQVAEFTTGAMAEIAEIKLEIQAREIVIEKKRDELADLFLEQKKYETLHNRQKKEALRKLRLKQQTELDEIAGAAHYSRST